MTRLTTNGTGRRRVAALHASQEAWRLVVIESAGPGRAQVVLAQSVAVDDAAGVREAMQQSQADRLVRVAPAEQTVCRVQPAQTGDAQQTASALALMAEAELAGVASTWRIGAGLIDDPAGDAEGGEGLALLTAWREGGVTPREIQPGETWTTEIAALAALRGGAGQLVLSASRGRGVVSLLASGAATTVARTVRESNDTADGWQAAVLSAAQETCRLVGAEIDVGEIEVHPALVWLDSTAMDTLRGRVQDLGAGEAWLHDYGVALGAAMLAATSDPARAPLAQLQVSAPAQRRGVVERVTEQVASPRRAAAVLAVGAALIVLTPLVVAWGRVALLEAGAQRAANFQDERNALAREAALYEQLEQSRLPMTRLLADVSSATPPHVVIDKLRLSRDQGLSLEGRVHIVRGEGEAPAPETPQQLVTELERNLAATGVFGGVRVNRSEVSEGSVQFEMTARVDRPHANPKPVIDFAERPLAQWLYGERGDNTAQPVALSEPLQERSVSSRRAGSTAAAPGASGSAESPRTSRGSAGDEETQPRETSSRRPDGEGAASEDGIPAELTDAQIEAMDASTALREMAARMRVRMRGDLDEGIKARLNAEIEKLKARRDQAAGGGQ